MRIPVVKQRAAAVHPEFIQHILQCVRPLDAFVDFPPGRLQQMVR
jgi:hypothetical protein